MTTKELLLAVLASSLLSGIFGALIAGWFTLRSKSNDYANDFYKLVVARRIEAYLEVERLIASIKIAVMDGEQRPYHFLFSEEDDAKAAYLRLASLLSQSMWLTDELFLLTREFNHLLFSRPGDQSLIDFAKSNYRRIAELRTKMERVHLADMRKLYDVPRFLKSKRPSDSYVSVAPAEQGLQ